MGLLRRAVRQVIKQNRDVGYNPARFIQMTENGESPDLIRMCEQFLTEAQALSAITNALTANPDIITLEELVADRADSEWGLSSNALDSASERANAFRTLRRTLKGLV